MISVLMFVATAVRLPCNLAWRGYGLLWWAFAENESLRDIWATPSRAVRVGWWLSIVGLFVAAAGALALGLNELASPARAFMGFAWAAVLVVAGSAFVGPRLARRSESPRPARSVESTLDGASRLIRERHAASQPASNDTPSPNHRHRSHDVRRAWRGVRERGRSVAGVMTVAARSGWAGVKHAAATYRHLRGEDRASSA